MTRELLLISDDVRRGARLARDLGTFRACRVHDLYDDALPVGRPGLIVGDVSALTSEAILRLQHLLAQVRAADVPFLFLAHGNAARAAAQAQVLGASGVLGAEAMSQMLLAALDGLDQRVDPATPAGERYAGAARAFIAAIFARDHAITPARLDTGTGLVARAIRESGVQAWVRTIQRFDDATHQHCLLVAGLAAAFASSLGLGAADSHHLTKAALLHDVGKIHVPSTILNKPGPLTRAEAELMRTHTVSGHAALVDQGFEDGLLAVVRSHHEMLDGSGYPDGLRGRQIPDLVRLVTVCDVYAALIEHRPYRAPTPNTQAFTILTDMAGRLDGDLVRAFHPVAIASMPI